VYGVTGYKKYGSGGSFTEDVIKVSNNNYALFANEMTSTASKDAAPARRGGKKTKKSKKGGGGIEGWRHSLTIRPLALIATADHLCISGVADKSDAQDYWKYLDGRGGGILSIHSRANGEKLAQYPLSAAPVHDGMAAASACVFISCQDGSLHCFDAP
jgi:hypothetical protein